MWVFWTSAGLKPPHLTFFTCLCIDVYNVIVTRPQHLLLLEFICVCLNRASLTAHVSLEPTFMMMERYKSGMSLHVKPADVFFFFFFLENTTMHRWFYSPMRFKSAVPTIKLAKNIKFILSFLLMYGHRNINLKGFCGLERR